MKPFFWSKLALGARNLSHAKWTNFWEKHSRRYREYTGTDEKRTGFFLECSPSCQVSGCTSTFLRFLRKRSYRRGNIELFTSKSMGSIGVLMKGVEISCQKRSLLRSLQLSVSQVGACVPHVGHGEIPMGPGTYRRSYTIKLALERSQRATDESIENSREKNRGRIFRRMWDLRMFSVKNWDMKNIPGKHCFSRLS